jgi:hypothetical protein
MAGCFALGRKAFECLIHCIDILCVEERNYDKKGKLIVIEFCCCLAVLSRVLRSCFRTGSYSTNVLVYFEALTVILGVSDSSGRAGPRSVLLNLNPLNIAKCGIKLVA